MKSKIFLMLLIVLMSVSSVSAYSRLECARDGAIMRSYLGTSHPQWDLNSDGVVNLRDVTILSQKCFNSDDSEDEADPEPVIKEKKSGSSIKIVTLPDGSKSYLFKAHAFQLERGVLLRWSPGYVGVFEWNNKRIMIEDGSGINIKEMIE